MKVELVNSLQVEVERWEDRKGRAVDRAKEDLDLIVPLVEEYYEARRPVEEKVVYSWEVVRGAEGLRRFLEGFKVVSFMYPKAQVRVVK